MTARGEGDEYVKAVRQFVRKQVLPVVDEYEHADRYPEELVEAIADLGLFGATIPEEFGGSGLPARTYVRIVEELAAGWMSLAGVINSHLIMARLIEQFGTAEQRQSYLPRMASGDFRGGLALSEAGAGSDAAALQTRAVRSDAGYVISGAKLWVTNGERASGLVVVARTDPAASPPHRGISAFLVERTDGYEPHRPHRKLGYKGIETCEVSFDDCQVGSDRLLGGVEGHGLSQVLAGLELGRLNVAARAVGVARASFEAALEFAQQRETFGKPISEHQTVQNQLADMGVRLRAARLLTDAAAATYDRGERADLEAGMAKLFASEAAATNALTAMRIHGGVGFTTELPIERYYRDAPLMLIGEGTSEIQRLVIARGFLNGQRP